MNIKLGSPIGTDELRLQWTNKILTFFLALGILLSLKLWLSERLFPLSPVLYYLKIGAPFDRILIALVLSAMILNLFLPQRLFTCFVVALLTFLLLLDQMRWQPWVYIYFLLLIPFIFKSDPDENCLAINSIQLTLPGIYVWSGIHKLNDNFVDYTRSIILEIFKAESSLSSIIQSTIQLIPYVEIIVGLSLLFPRFRIVGVVGVISIHITILLLIGPFGGEINSIVWPWSIAMICLVMLAFFRDNHEIIFFPMRSLKFRMLNLVLVALIWVLPSLNFFKLWDNYLSFSLYSGKVSNFYIAVRQDQLDKIDERLSNYFARINDLQGGEVIDIQRWSMEELNVPFTGQRRVFENVCESFCTLNLPNDALFFLEITKSADKMETLSTTCLDLRKED